MKIGWKVVIIVQQLTNPVMFYFSGHLMGKKSIKSLPAQQEKNFDRDYLTPSEQVRISKLDRHGRPMAALQPENRKQTAPQRLPRLHSNWREEDREVYLREVSLI